MTELWTPSSEIQEHLIQAGWNTTHPTPSGTNIATAVELGFQYHDEARRTLLATNGRHIKTKRKSRQEWINFDLELTLSLIDREEVDAIHLVEPHSSFPLAHDGTHIFFVCSNKKCIGLDIWWHHIDRYDSLDNMLSFFLWGTSRQAVEVIDPRKFGITED